MLGRAGLRQLTTDAFPGIVGDATRPSLRSLMIRGEIMSKSVNTPQLTTPEKAADGTKSYALLARQRLGRAAAVLRGVSSVCSVSLNHENRDMSNDESISISCLTNIALEALDEADRFIDATLVCLEVIPVAKPATKRGKAVRS
ncbi:MAG: hypothetical protein AMXMBFR13_49320 [Phycisphaerae bacterium]